MAFLESALLYGGDDCLFWPFARSKKGYAAGATFVGNPKAKMPHRALCEAVNGEPPTPIHQAAHSCGNGLKGCVSPRHLRWKTPMENSAERIEHGRSGRAESHPNSKLTTTDVRRIRMLSGLMQGKDIAEIFGVNKSTVCKLLKGRAWAHSFHTGSGAVH